MEIMMNTARHQEIKNLITTLEAEKGIKVIHAVESGSRAWGFPSKDSDYDVRIIYHHEQDWYISPFEKKDTLEIPITDDLDIAGWDIAKALGLLYRGNATVHEWLGSPVVYQSNLEKHALLHKFSEKEFNSAPTFYHYISLAKKKFLDEQTQFNAKSFLYGLRALLCANWVTDNNTAPPVLFSKLTSHYLAPPQAEELDILLTEKFELKEKDTYKIPNKLWQYGIERYKEVSNNFSEKKKQENQEAYEQLLRKLIV